MKTIHTVAADICSRLPALQADSCVNREQIVANLIKPLLEQKPAGDYQSRVKAEKLELDERIEKLTSFINNEVRNKLTFDECILLNRQRDAMLLYSQILKERIASFK